MQDQQPEINSEVTLEKELERTMSLRDVVLFNIVSIAGVTMIATASRTGVTGLTLFLIGAVLFFIPEGLAVNNLAVKYPGEGGIYLWTKTILGKGHGFICGWCYWINTLLYLPSMILSGAVIAGYMFPGNENFTTKLIFILPFILIVLWGSTFANIVGLKTGKWVQNLGGITTFLPFTLLAFAGFYALATQPAANSFKLSNWIPDLHDLSNINLWATIPFAYAGLELSSTLAGEIKNPKRNLPLSVFITAPIVFLFYFIGCASILYVIPKEKVDTFGGTFQSISVMMNKISPHLWWIVVIAVAGSVVARLGSVGAWLSGCARIALVVGVDKYLPPAFARVHPKWKTPHLTFLIQSGIATVFLLIAVLGKGSTAANVFFILLDMSIILGFIPYLYMFICYLKNYFSEPTGKKPILKILTALAGLSGTLVTLIAIFVAMIPTPGSNFWEFEIKVIGGCLFLLLVGGFFYWRGEKKMQ